MTSRVTREFQRRLNRPPPGVEKQAAQAYALWRLDPYHNSLQFKRVGRREPIYSVRIGIGYRALGFREADCIYWFWIGSHAAYDELLRRL